MRKSALPLYIPATPVNTVDEATGCESASVERLKSLRYCSDRATPHSVQPRLGISIPALHVSMTRQEVVCPEVAACYGVLLSQENGHITQTVIPSRGLSRGLQREVVDSWSFNGVPSPHR